MVRLRLLYDAVVNGHDAERYWDPMPHLDARLDLAATFRGRWHERNWRNVPGPVYGAETDNCWVGRLHAPRHVLYGDDNDYGQEFLYRQPNSIDELRAVVDAVQADPVAGWACDGDDHWTPALVRQWWRDRSRLRDWITAELGRCSVSDRADEREVATGLADYLAYLDGDLEGHLWAYCEFLDHRAGR